MGKPTGFLEHDRSLPNRRPVEERIKDYKEVDGAIEPGLSQRQASRCMDCGTPFCHHGCPLGNNIPEFNDAVYKGNWRLAYDILITTNNFPEFTGRICPAPCEASCVLGINKPAVTIEYIEKSVIEKAFEDGYVLPRKPSVRTGRKVAIIGSGPAGLAAASQLNYAGHRVTVFERADAIGGLLRYGIPDFKLGKEILDRRISMMEQEGVAFRTNAHVGVNIPINEIQDEHDAILMCAGSTVARDLHIPGRGLKGVHFAMDYLSQQNRRISGKDLSGEVIHAKGKRVVVLGGGDTGSDCVGTANRHGAESVTQIEILSKPPQGRTSSMPWPQWPMILRTSTSHEEGCDRNWSIVTKAFEGNDQGVLTGIKICDIQWHTPESGQPSFTEVAGTDRVIPCDIVLLALGFLHPERKGMLTELGIEADERGNVKCHQYQTSVEGIFAAGDMRRGQSLVVWAISEGREAARAVDEFLMGVSFLEQKEKGILNVI